MSDKAVEHLETAEAAILNYMNRASEAIDEGDDENHPDAIPMLMAVMGALGRAIGVLEGGRQAMELLGDGEPSTPVLKTPYGDTPLCETCGHITVGKVYHCINCGKERDLDDEP